MNNQIIFKEKEKMVKCEVQSENKVLLELNIKQLKDQIYQWEIINIKPTINNYYALLIQAWKGFINKYTCRSCKIHTNITDESLIECGFKINDNYAIYYPFGIVYRIDDTTDKTFYIGMCENKKNWNNGYLGSGTRWLNHLKKHPNHSYKRTILHECKTPQETRNKELKEICKYFIFFKDDTWEKNNEKCLNIRPRTQGNEYTPSKCPECGTTNGHTKNCKYYKKPKTPPPCPECGGQWGHHRKGCKKLEKCPECGYPIQSAKHSKTCSYYQEPTKCSECGSKGSVHKEWCSKYKPRKKCPECNGPINSHKKWCSKYKKHTCPECGSGTTHKEWCSKYKKPKRTPCPICGGINGHKDTCTKSKGKCPICGYSLKSHQHAKTCPHYKPRKKAKPCPICGSTHGHKKHCKHYTTPKPCPICGAKKGHKKHCSKYSRKVCPKCGVASGHKKTCPDYKPRKQTNKKEEKGN